MYGNIHVTLDLRGNIFLDLVLELYAGPEGTTPVRRANAGGYGRNEQITYYARPGYVYYIKIYEKNTYVFDRSRYYSLSVN